ncbi:MAG: FG-GAP repeat protein [Planctomycetota bacterium]
MCTTTFRKGVWGVGYALLAVFASHSASGQVLHESAKWLASDGTAEDYFGNSVSVFGDVAVVGAPQHDDKGTDSGSAYVFRWNGSSWVQEQKLLASDGSAVDLFGGVSISGDVLVVGAHHDRDANGSWRGSAYVFRYHPELLPGDPWVEEQKLLGSDATGNAWFGFSVSVSGDVALVGALYEFGGATEFTSAYMFRYHPERPVGDRWLEEQKLLASDGANYDLFGCSVSVSSDVGVVGAAWDDDNGTNSGSAYVFRWNGSSWVQEQKLLASDGASDDNFSNSVSVSGDVAVIGADLDDDNGTDSGSAYVFRWNGSSWVQQQKLLPSDGVAGDGFGVSVSVSGDVGVVGARMHAGNDYGSAYVFRWNGSSWVQEEKLLPSDGAGADRFAHSVSVSGDVAVVGAYWDDDNGTNSGSAYVFSLVGTCCISNGSCEAAGNCQENITPSACQALGGRFFGPNVSCAQACVNGACIPAVSAWGIVVLLLLIATAGTIVLARGRVPAR